ncbi:MAG: PadR family transcriptional regulator [Erysipelotrichaceae bacterium]|nr:PadR family transcriptional regulator [Erysipelotrichaceae bacterium]
MAEQTALTESTFYILLALYKPMHGYGIMQQVLELSKGRIRMAPGTLYGALNTMCEKGWIIQLPVEDGSRKKDYKLTEKGKQILLGEIGRLKELVKNADLVIGEINND